MQFLSPAQLLVWVPCFYSCLSVVKVSRMLVIEQLMKSSFCEKFVCVALFACSACSFTPWFTNQGKLKSIMEQGWARMSICFTSSVLGQTDMLELWAGNTTNKGTKYKEEGIWLKELKTERKCWLFQKKREEIRIRSGASEWERREHNDWKMVSAFTPCGRCAR